MVFAAAPLVSVVVPVYNGVGLVERAFASLRRQTLEDWECLIVDDASTDASAAALRRLAASDARLRVTRLPVNRGVSEARNVALGQARGEWIAYLDQDDEFYPGYLALIREHAASGADVLMFRYDLVEERRDHPQFGRTYTQDPAVVRDRLFREHIAVPLGVAHTRRLTEHTGGFDERRPREQDSEMWRRFASSGAAFAFVAEASGLYHIRSERARREPARPIRRCLHGKLRLLCRGGNLSACLSSVRTCRSPPPPKPDTKSSPYKSRTVPCSTRCTFRRRMRGSWRRSSSGESTRYRGTSSPSRRQSWMSEGIAGLSRSTLAAYGRRGRCIRSNPTRRTWTCSEGIRPRSRA